MDLFRSDHHWTECWSAPEFIWQLARLIGQHSLITGNIFYGYMGRPSTRFIYRVLDEMNEDGLAPGGRALLLVNTNQCWTTYITCSATTSADSPPRGHQGKEEVEVVVQYWYILLHCPDEEEESRDWSMSAIGGKHTYKNGHYGIKTLVDDDDDGVGHVFNPSTNIHLQGK